MPTEHRTAAEFVAMQGKAVKASKFRNVKTVVDGITFDSRKEAKRWGELVLLEKAGKIHNLIRQFRYELVVRGIPVCFYVCDFRYIDLSSGNVVVVIEDVKSEFTRKNPVYRIKRKLMEACHGLTITEV